MMIKLRKMNEKEYELLVLLLTNKGSAKAERKSGIRIFFFILFLSKEKIAVSKRIPNNYLFP